MSLGRMSEELVILEMESLELSGLRVTEEQVYCFANNAMIIKSHLIILYIEVIVIVNDFRN